MAREQFGICAEPSLHGYYLLFNVIDDDNVYLKQALSRLPKLFDNYADHYSEANLTGVVAIGANYWDELYPQARPKELSPFSAIACDDRIAPSVSFDLYIEIRSDRADVNYIVSTKVVELLASSVDLVEQIRAFRFLDGRDLTGFVDGTENPKGYHKRNVALVTDEQESEFAGGSYLHIQRYRHNMQLWNAIEQKEQEDVIGRTKVDNIEYSKEDKPATAHSHKVNIKDSEGKSIEILRQSMPYGDMKIQGLFFVSYCHSAKPFETMLKAMINTDEEGNFDHLLKYTQAETGASFFAPSLNFLDKLADLDN